MDQNLFVDQHVCNSGNRTIQAKYNIYLRGETSNDRYVRTELRRLYNCSNNPLRVKAATLYGSRYVIGRTNSDTNPMSHTQTELLPPHLPNVNDGMNDPFRKNQLYTEELIQTLDTGSSFFHWARNLKGYLPNIHCTQNFHRVWYRINAYIHDTPIVHRPNRSPDSIQGGMYENDEVHINVGWFYDWKRCAMIGAREIEEGIKNKFGYDPTKT